MQQRNAEEGLETKVSAAVQSCSGIPDNSCAVTATSQSRGQMSRVLPLTLAALDQHTLTRVLKLSVVHEQKERSQNLTSILIPSHRCKGMCVVGTAN